MKTLRKIFYSLTPRQRRLARRLWYLPTDIFRKRKPLTPPQGMIYTGAGDFIGIGDKIVNEAIKACAFTPHGKVLDIGCGMGRMARPFTQLLNGEGAYYGFDVVESGIVWCKRHYRQFRNFHFDYAAVSNGLYNDKAATNDWEFRFNYDCNFFDLVISISVFTHMQEKGVKNYLAEIGRTLKPGKCCFATFFIMDEERKMKFESGKSFFNLKEGRQYLHDQRVKDANVAYEYLHIEQMAEAAGLTITRFLPGWWNDGDKKGKFDFQDVLIFKKVSPLLPQ